MIPPSLDVNGLRPSEIAKFIAGKLGTNDISSAYVDGEESPG